MATPGVRSVPPVHLYENLVQADGTNFVTLHTVTAEKGIDLGSLRATSTFSSAVTLQFAATLGGVDHILGEVQVPAGAGTNGTTGYVDILDQLNAGLVLSLAPSLVLKVKSKTEISTGAVFLFGIAAPLA